MESPKRRADLHLVTAVNTHLYPRILHDSRLAFRLFHAAVHALTLRNWYVRRRLRQISRRLEFGSFEGTVVDAGSGAGDHLFYVARRATRATCIGMDRSAEAVELCRRHAGGDGRIQFRHADLDAAPEIPAADLLLCITVLQYVRDDTALLKAFRRAIRPEGRLLLYVPMRNERVLPFFERVVSGGPSDYDSVQGRRRVYQLEEVRGKLAEAGFVIESAEEAYGAFGKLAFELQTLLLHGMIQHRLPIRALAAISGLLLLPPLLVLMVVDYVAPVRSGNGWLVVARPAHRPTNPGNFSIAPA